MHHVGIKFFRELLEEGTEYCGIFEKEKFDFDDGVCFFIKDLVPGVNLPGRKSCQHKKYSSIIFHTHPNSSKPYPSFEDINKIAKRKSIKVSCIFTSWGLWIIKNKNTRMGDEYKNDDSVFIDIYKISKFNVAYEERMIGIDEFIQKVDKAYNIDLEFVEYDRLKNMCFYTDD